MPDNNGGILGGLSNFFGSIGGPTYLANVQRQQLEAAAQRYQFELFQRQLQEQLGPDPDHPKMSYGQALYNLQNPAFNPEVRGLPAYGQPIKGGNGREVPVGFQGGQPFVGLPPGLGPSNPQPVGQAAAPQNVGGTNQAQAVPGVGAQNGTPPALQQVQPFFDFFRKQDAEDKAANELATKQADALQQYPSALTTARDAIARLEAHRDNPDLPNIVGGTLGVKGRTSALGQGQADLVNESNELQSKIIANTLMATRGVSGRNTNPGTLKELAVGAGDLISARKGTLEGYKQVIDNSIDLIKRETQAAWEATGGRGEKPNWPTNTGAAAPKFREGQTATNKQTGERILFTNGRWGPHP